MAALEIPESSTTETFTRSRHRCSSGGQSIGEAEYYYEGCGAVEGRDAD
jgi:hypothetical protein